ncbi:histidine kinase [Marinicella sp. S1101]|uniref:sensor histidine kinase n=1 Tax=Marinicella marina TaxID=2996016 RepID=UPI002260C923|nr:histidine kinase [Marinicella marina]MCX7553653.1 histidine kinase [Marinicella marina]MDJ1140277.1 histidine kinase [Marinicella marina]
MINLGYDWHRFASLREALEVGGLKTLTQWLVAFFAIQVLVPKFLHHKRHLAFGLSLLLLALLMSQFYIAVSYLYLEPTYPLTYGAFYNNNLADYSLIERLGFSDMIRYIVISKIPTLLFPAVVLIAVNFYEEQQRLLAYKEQKQAAELQALKTQLNPHFIFNTLNNIYSLAISGSTHTAEAVAKLSGIFDYVLYRCNERFVSLDAEVEMIENYVALEALRYGDRLNTNIDNQIKKPTQVAPLLYLTLVENAFKHGVTQELNQARINITIKNNKQGAVVFTVENTKPINNPNNDSHQPIGLANLKRQLKLIYPDQHQLNIVETVDTYAVELVIGSELASEES